MLFGWTDQEGWDGRVMWDVCETGEVRTGFWGGKLMEWGHLEDLGVDGGTVLVWLKDFTEQAMKAQAVIRGVAILFALTSALDGGGWLASRPDCFTPGKRPGTCCTGGLVGTRAGLDGCGKWQPQPGFNPRTGPALSEALYRLSYTGPRMKRGPQGNWLGVLGGGVLLWTR
jgi:hypothetical protein